jgi:hypothetical protein
VVALAHLVLLASLVIPSGFFSLQGGVIIAIPAILFAWLTGMSIVLMRVGRSSTSLRGRGLSRATSASSPSTASPVTESPAWISLFSSASASVSVSSTQLRDTLVAIVPGAEQCISYGMPALKWLEELRFTAAQPKIKGRL